MIPGSSPPLSRAVPDQYWEARAQRFAHHGQGLAAVCSYGMPAFYNRYIQFTQRLALRRWLRVQPDDSVLDVGCGVGRWSRVLAAKGARVTGIDLSPTMVIEAERRAKQAGLSTRCRFMVQDLAQFDTGQLYSLIVGVTVLQHILDPIDLNNAVARLVSHLSPGGRMVLLEAAPTGSSDRCDSAIFTARNAEFYATVFAAAGLKIETMTGVDPSPLKTWFLPYYARLPRPVAQAAMLAVTAMSLPVDALLGRLLTSASWHKVFVLRHDGR